MGLKLEHVSYLYGTDTELLVRALDDVNLEIPDGQFIGLIGHTGSGKSTLVQHLNGLLKPSEGTILFNGENIWAQDYSRKTLRSKLCAASVCIKGWKRGSLQNPGYPRTDCGNRKSDPQRSKNCRNGRW